MKTIMAKWVYGIIIIALLFPISLCSEKPEIFNASLALLTGIIFALIFRNPYPQISKSLSKYLLQASIVGYGFTMNLQSSLQSGLEGMSFTIISVAIVMFLGIYIGKCLKISQNTTYLISSGTAICGGSAIAAISPIIRAKDNEMAVSLGVVFILNAIALFIFPIIGRFFNMSDTQFGTWAAIAIHDTSSVVGAGQAYSDLALQTATMVKLTRALWIIPLSLVSAVYFKQRSNKISIPWFIILFILAMSINSVTSLPFAFTNSIGYIAQKGMILTLFLIGSTLSIDKIKSVGYKPFMLAIILWITTAVVSFLVITNTIS